MVNESGIEIKPLYTAEDVDRQRRHRCSAAPGECAIHPRHPSADVPAAAVHHAAVHRLRQCRRDQPALQISDRQRPDRAQRRLRSADAVRLRFRRRRKPIGEVGRVGMAVDTLARFRGRLRRHRPRRHHGVAHHQRRRRDPDRHVSRHGGEARLRHYASCAARRRTTSSRSSSAAAPGSSRSIRRSSSSATPSSTAPRWRRNTAR